MGARRSIVPSHSAYVTGRRRARLTRIHAYQASIPTTASTDGAAELDLSSLSETEHFREKWFRHVLYGFDGALKWPHWFDFGYYI